MKKWRIASLIAVFTLILSGCGLPHLSALNPAGEVAKKQYDLMVLSTAIMVLVIVVVVILFVLAILRFRRRKGDNSIPKQIEGNHKLEILWTVIPIVLLIILAVPTIYYTFYFSDVSAKDGKDKDGNPTAVQINVRASLYWWEFEYPNDGIVTGQELVVPTDEKVYFNLKASDVKHSFWVPSAGGKLDTNTDNVNEFWLEFDDEKSEEAERVFYGKCAELCGPSHALMDFKVKALPREEYDAWVAEMKETKQSEVELTDATAQEGQEIFNKSCIGCHAIDTNDQRPEQARLAPNLANFADRELVAGYLENNEENVKKWLEDPEALKEGNKMTDTYGELTDEQINALTKYLGTLSVED